MPSVCVPPDVVLALCKCHHKRVCVLFIYVSVGALQGDARTEDLLDSWAGRLILHGLSKRGEEERSHYSRYRMHPAVVPSAWIHMNAPDWSFPALSALKKTKMLNTDMYSTFMRTWASSLSECSVERSRIQKKTPWRLAFSCRAEQDTLRWMLVSVHWNTPIVMVLAFVFTFSPLLLLFFFFCQSDRLKIGWHFKD